MMSSDIDISQIDSWPKAIVTVAGFILFGFVVWCFFRIFR